MRIIPSIASARQLDLKGQLDRIEDVPYLHIDVEDGNFLPNITFGMKTVREMAAYSKAELDVHLLVTNPISYIQELSEMNISAVCGHMEALSYPLEFLNEVHSAGMKAGLALNLSLPVEQIMSYAGSFDYLLLMTSEPDGSGQMFCPNALERIRRARACIPDDVMIYADGGIGRNELGKVAEAGADCVIMGRAVWGAENPAKAWREMEALNGYGTDSKAFRNLRKGH
ncbi:MULTISPECIES: ribulose-phosphate 3-epimerase [unclassified Clostridium]|uniref:ribulose-phosphate 3-epimerase n=1 Tax=unclassified Clostridium TaxID=2614128 RepID=UPI0011072FFF|nr:MULTISPECIES: ribulose-phosphate 3-epimerase [unclassified Clostridium]